MEFQNLGKNILYLVSNELKRREACGPLEAGLIYEAFSDLPADAIAGSIVSLADRGLLRLVQNDKKVQITEEGLSEIRGFVPSRLEHTCKPPEECADTSAEDGPQVD